MSKLKPLPEKGAIYNNFTLTGNTLIKSGTFRWECKCICGQIRHYMPSQIKTGQRKSCGCLRYSNPSKPRKFSDPNLLVGMKFGKLTIIKILSICQHGEALVFCDCGTEKIVKYSYLKNGTTTSCGCIKNGVLKQRYQFKDLVGKRIGHIVVLDDLLVSETGVKFKMKVRCDCGREEYKGAYNLFKCRHMTCSFCRGAGLGGKYFSAAFLNRKMESARKRNFEFTITAADLDEAYDKQNGLCYYTGRKMELPTKQNRYGKVSIDRLDNNKGYTKDNIVLCLVGPNLAKLDNPLEDFIVMCNQIAKTHPRSV